jgi:CDP-6-deoxy-D-xylo-4-hexulose-3-dehydrase
VVELHKRSPGTADNPGPNRSDEVELDETFCNSQSPESCAGRLPGQSTASCETNGSEVDLLKDQIFELVRKYYSLAFPRADFVAGESRIPCAGRVFDEDELVAAVESSLEFWLTLGRFGAEFEKEFAAFFGTRFATLVNSGSSANLLALTCLTSPSLNERRLSNGDEVITCACGFPTTVNPIVQNGLQPVFLDVTIPTYNIDTRQLEAALSKKTRAIMLAHTLGNPFDVDTVVSFAKKHGLFLIEDCCDAVGSTYKNKPVGTFGDLSTVSFYPAHHMTMGEGGCVMTNQAMLRKVVESLRDWGRDCWCDPGVANTCGKRFDWQLGELPHGFDHKYIYSHIGYNLKPTDIQAAIGLAQLKKLDTFIRVRRENFSYLTEGLKDLKDFFVLPEATAASNPSWFGFPLFLRPDCGIARKHLVEYLEAKQIATRLLFAGNLIRQPAYQGINYRAVSDLAQSDLVMHQVFWVGLYPALKRQALDYMLDVFHKAVKEVRR